MKSVHSVLIWGSPCTGCSSWVVSVCEAGAGVQASNEFMKGHANFIQFYEISCQTQQKVGDMLIL